METVLAIDIHDECVTGVLLNVEPRGAVVSGYGAALIDDEGTGEAVADVVRQTGYKEGDVRISIGAEKLFFRNLLLPFTDRKKIDKVLPFELEELTSYTIDDLQLDFLSTVVNEEGTEILAAMFKKGELAETLAMFQQQGLDPELVGVSGLQTAACLVTMTSQKTFVLLDVSYKQATFVLVDDGRIAIIRSLAVNSEVLAGFRVDLVENNVMADDPAQIPEIVRRLVLPVQQTLLSVGRSAMLSKDATCYVNGVVGSHPEVLKLLKIELPLDVQPCNIASQPQLRINSLGNSSWNPAMMNRALALGLWSKKLTGILNFRKGDFKKRQSLKSIRKLVMGVALPLTLICIGVIGFSWWEYNELKSRRNALRTEIESIFRQAMPEVTRITDPLKELTVKVNETRDIYSSGSSGQENIRKLDLLSELSLRIPQSLPLLITRLVADKNDVRIKAETKDFNTVDNVKKELEKSDYFSSVVISSANLAPKGGEVRFELKLELRK